MALSVIAVLSSCGGSSGKAATPTATAPVMTTPGVATAGVATAAPAPLVSAGPTGSASTTVARCTATDLAVTLAGDAPAGTSQRTVDVTFTNRSSTRCSMFGYPGAQLRAGSGATYDLERSPLVPTATIVLGSGARAHATLTYLPANATSTPVFTPTRLVVTPPDERTSTVLAWTGGPIVRQDAATHPGTYITAVKLGA
jgi:hypothetical protein